MNRTSAAITAAPPPLTYSPGQLLSLRALSPVQLCLAVRWGYTVRPRGRGPDEIYSARSPFVLHHVISVFTNFIMRRSIHGQVRCRQFWIWGFPCPWILSLGIQFVAILIDYDPVFDGRPSPMTLRLPGSAHSTPPSPIGLSLRSCIFLQSSWLDFSTLSVCLVMLSLGFVHI